MSSLAVASFNILIVVLGVAGRLELICRRSGNLYNQLSANVGIARATPPSRS